MLKWLIEREVDGVIVYYVGHHRSLIGPGLRARWDRDPTSAHWYYSKTGAELIIEEYELRNARAIEHEFVNPTRGR